MFSQIPGGALADATTWKPGLITVGIVTIGAAALILAFSSSFILVIFAELLHGSRAGILPLRWVLSAWAWWVVEPCRSVPAGITGMQLGAMQ